MKRDSEVACWKGCVAVFLSALMLYCPRVTVAEAGRPLAPAATPTNDAVATQAADRTSPAVTQASRVEAGASLESEYARREAEARDSESFAGGQSDAFVSAVTVTLLIAGALIVVLLDRKSVV
jgi:hypothetical protein